MEGLRGWKPGSPSHDSYRRRIAWWSEMVKDFLGELYSLRHAADTISQRYFDGRQIAFPTVAEEFARLIACLEEMVEGYNEDFANEFGQNTGSAQESQDAANPPNFIDSAALEKEVSQAAGQHAAFLVDMARAEALDAFGENKPALAIVERHI
jgi:hypothetical protein